MVAKGMRMAASLTCLQLLFAMYATFLLYFMSPTVDLRANPDNSWSAQIAKQWSGLLGCYHGPMLLELANLDAANNNTESSTDPTGGL